MNEREILKELYKISFYNWKTYTSKFKGPVKCQHNDWRQTHSKTINVNFQNITGEAKILKFPTSGEKTDKIDTKFSKKLHSSSQKQY